MEGTNQNRLKDYLALFLIMLSGFVSGAFGYLLATREIGSRVEILQNEVQTLQNGIIKEKQVLSKKIKDETANWLGFKFENFDYGYTVTYPPEYTKLETTSGGLIFKFHNDTVLDYYFKEGDYADSVDSYLNPDSEIFNPVSSNSIALSNVKAKKILGVFGKEAGIRKEFDGKSGTVIIYPYKNGTFIIDSVDNGDPKIKSNFELILSKLIIEKE